jgi:hypothetical protein
MEPILRTVVQRQGYLRQHLTSGISILRLLDSSPEAIEAWYEECNLMMANWRPGQRLRYVHDIRAAERITPRGTDRVARVLRRMRSIPVTDGRGAILLHNPALANLLAPFLRPKAPARWLIQFFDDEAEAIAWLSK